MGHRSYVCLLNLCVGLAATIAVRIAIHRHVINPKEKFVNRKIDHQATPPHPPERLTKSMANETRPRSWIRRAALIGLLCLPKQPQSRWRPRERLIPTPAANPSSNTAAKSAASRRATPERSSSATRSSVEGISRADNRAAPSGITWYSMTVKRKLLGRRNLGAALNRNSAPNAADNETVKTAVNICARSAPIDAQQ